MKALVDTSVFLFWAMGSPRLGAAARRFMSSGKNELLFSAVSAWEIGIKHALGKLTLPDDPAKYLPKTFARWSITPIPLEYPEALAAALLPPIHEDPFDRALIAQAIARKVPILTSDARFEEYGVRVIA